MVYEIRIPGVDLNNHELDLILWVQANGVDKVRKMLDGIAVRKTGINNNAVDVDIIID
jgi:hypothetical protein